MTARQELACWLAASALGCVVACGSDAGVEASGFDAGIDASTEPTPFADRVVSFTPGANAGFGQERFPDIVLGPPQGMGPLAGSLDVLSLGNRGCIVLEFADIEVVDGDGIDFAVFENPFRGFVEPGIVSVSLDGDTWSTFECATDDPENDFPGCAGTEPVHSSPSNEIPATDPNQSGGDLFDLVDVGLASARFVRICDAGVQHYGGMSGGFDLDAVAVVNGQPAAR